MILKEGQREGHYSRAWLDYDTMFRQQAAVSKPEKWAQINNTIWNMCFLRSADYCTICKSRSHKTAECTACKSHTEPHCIGTSAAIPCRFSTFPQVPCSLLPSMLAAFTALIGTGRGDAHSHHASMHTYVPFATSPTRLTSAASASSSQAPTSC